MIRIENLTKRYRLGKGRHQTVTDHLSLSLEDKGLVVFLGPSGSGKTTLLHLLGGMDRFDSGWIEFGGIKILRYRHRLWDRMHRKHIAYVFQQHQLLPDRSVADNIALALRLRGIRTKADIEKEVNSLLGVVGLEGYADRLIRQLSGGQQQRVAVARGLAIGPDALFADEPTGNLDGKNTLELMRLFREIARDRLVVMVTHNELIARHFADRILELKNGRIVKDEPNRSPLPLSEELEHEIHLKHYRKQRMEDGPITLDHYVKSTEDEAIRIDLIERPQTLFVRVAAKAGKRVKLLSEDNGIVVFDGEPKEAKTLSLPDSFAVPLGIRTARAFRFIDLWRMAWHTMRGVFHHSKRWMAALALIGMVVALSVGLLGEANAVNVPVAVIDPHYIGIVMRRADYPDLALLEEVEGVDHVVAFEGPRQFTIRTEPFFQVRSTIDLEAVPIDVRFLKETDLIYGEMPEEWEIVVDKSVADELVEQYKDRGIATYDDVLRASFVIQSSGADINLSPDRKLAFSISGIADRQSKSVWMKEELIYSFITPSMIDYHILGNGFSILSGDHPTSEMYILLNEQYPALLNGEIPQSVGFGTGSYLISGIYRYQVDGVPYDFSKLMVSNLAFIRSRFFRFEYSNQTEFEVMAYAEDVELALARLEEAGYDCVDHRFDLELAKRMKMAEVANLYILGLSGIALAGLCVLIIIRSQLIERRYEIGVYRGIGIARGEIRMLFLIESLVVALFSSVLSFLLTVLVLTAAESSFARLSITEFGLESVLLGLFGLLLIHALFALVPVERLLWKTPAELMKQSDI